MRTSAPLAFAFSLDQQPVGVAGPGVAAESPEIHDLLAVTVAAARAAEFPATREVVDKCVPHSLEAGTDVTVDV